MDNQRMTWDEIVKKYPDKWVGMSQMQTYARQWL